MFGEFNGQIAQSVEQRIENPRVGGSIPSLATFFKPMTLASCALLITGCSAPCVVWNDQCESLCCDVGTFLEESCREQSWTWSDLGAIDRASFIRQCIRDWDDLNSDLTTYEAQQAIEVCDTSRDAIQLPVRLDENITDPEL